MLEVYVFLQGHVYSCETRSASTVVCTYVCALLSLRCVTECEMFIHSGNSGGHSPPACILINQHLLLNVSYMATLMRII